MSGKQYNYPFKSYDTRLSKAKKISVSFPHIKMESEPTPEPNTAPPTAPDVAASTASAPSTSLASASTSAAPVEPSASTRSPIVVCRTSKFSSSYVHYHIYRNVRCCRPPICCDAGFYPHWHTSMLSCRRQLGIQ